MQPVEAADQNGLAADGLAAGTIPAVTSGEGRGQEFWRSAVMTRMAGDGYYADAARAIEDLVVPLIPADASVLDAGCGDGSYTALLAQRAGRVDAFDLSPALITQAEELGLSNVTWSVGDVTDLPADTWNVVSCMGVLVCLLDDDLFASTLSQLAASVAPGGLLVLRETLSGWGARTVENAQHTGRYRTRSAHLDLLDGFELVAERRLAVWSKVGRRSNHLLVFRRS